MKSITGIEFYSGTREEKLPDFESDFPCVTTYSILDHHPQPTVPWHWHKAVELFYVQSGALEYRTPRQTLILPEGCGGLVNSNILHMTSHQRNGIPNIQMLHLFDPAFLAGSPGSRIDQKYIRPLTASSGHELIPLFLDHPKHALILHEIRESFQISQDMPGYEFFLREKLSRIWFQIFSLLGDQLNQEERGDDTSDRVKKMMAYIHEHYGEPLPIRTLAQAGICSERECYRAFHACLHMTPAAYLQSYRLQIACQMLTSGKESLTEIAHSCGFSSSSYLGKVFRSVYGCTPMEYRNARQNSDTGGQ